MSTLLQDLRYGLRMLAKNPGFTTVVVVVLALGIGANTTLFSLVNNLVIRSLPVANPQRLAVASGGIPTYPFVPQLPGYTYRV